MQLASQLSQALSERDVCASNSRELTQKYEQSEKEIYMLQKELADLGSQVQALLRELSRRDDPTIPDDEDMTETPDKTIDEIISNNLVLFRSIPELQEQNRKLLRVTRELGAKMESEEREYKDALDQEQSEAIREAHEAIQALQVQLENQQKSQQATIQAYVKERDTLKTMLARSDRNVGSASASTHAGSSIHINGNATSHPPSDLQKELHEVQTNFDAYRHEMGIDTIKLREELVAYQREASQLGSALAKANAKIDFLNGTCVLFHAAKVTFTRCTSRRSTADGPGTVCAPKP